MEVLFRKMLHHPHLVFSQESKQKKAATVPKVDCVAMATVSTTEVVRVVIRTIRLKANYGMYLKLC